MNRNHVRASRNGRAVRGAGTTFTGGSWGGCMAEGTSPREEWHLELRLVSQVWSASVGITHLCSIQQWKTTEVFYLLEKDKAHWRQTHFFSFLFFPFFCYKRAVLRIHIPSHSYLCLGQSEGNMDCSCTRRVWSGRLERERDVEEWLLGAQCWDIT